MKQKDYWLLFTIDWNCMDRPHSSKVFIGKKCCPFSHDHESEMGPSTSCLQFTAIFHWTMIVGERVIFLGCFWNTEVQTHTSYWKNNCHGWSTYPSSPKVTPLRNKALIAGLMKGKPMVHKPLEWGRLFLWGGIPWGGRLTSRQWNCLSPNSLTEDKGRSCTKTLCNALEDTQLKPEVWPALRWTGNFCLEMFVDPQNPSRAFHTVGPFAGIS